MDKHHCEIVYQHLLLESVLLFFPPFSLRNNTAEIGREQPQQSGELEGDETYHSCKPSSLTHHLSTLLYISQSDLRVRVIFLSKFKTICVRKHGFLP